MEDYWQRVYIWVFRLGGRLLDWSGNGFGENIGILWIGERSGCLLDWRLRCFWVFSVGVVDVVGVCHGCCGFVSWGLFSWCCG